LKLRIKFIIANGGILLLSYGLLFLYSSNKQHDLIYGQAKEQARMLHRQIILTRKWVADHHGLFLIRRDDVQPNPFLDNPIIQTTDGQVYVKRNPAMVTRELSEYAFKDGWCTFRVTSLRPINPANVPDEFEQQGLLKLQENHNKEIIAIEDAPGGRILRYLAPLKIENSCLPCHAQHGYKFGDIRGGLSIVIPIQWADKMINDNNRSIILYSLLSIIAVSAMLFWLFSTLVSRPLAQLTATMDKYPDHPVPKPEHHRVKDEIDTICDTYYDLCRRLDESRETLDKAKNQAFQNEKMASLGLLTSGIAHEVNNPLGGLLNCVKALREDPENPQLIERYLPLLDKGLRSIEHTMHQLLNFGRNTPLDLKKINVDQIIRECFELLSYRMQRIDLQLDLNLDKTYCIDVESLQQTIVNIGLNAIQAMGAEGGAIRVKTEVIRQSLKIRIEDTGPGIPPEILDKIFDPFFTTKDVGIGTGLGLAVSYAQVEKMGGTLIAGSKVGHGASFTITLPATENCALIAQQVTDTL
jgi:signal transduction histidine kinase